MTTRNSYLLPIAIVLAGALLAVGLYVYRVESVPAPVAGDPSQLRPVDDTDHIIGNPAAPVVIVEYSDIDCAYCKLFQATLAQLMSEYAPSGRVAWVYRHFPVLSAHPGSASHAEAAECAAANGDADAFWRFIDALHQAAPDSKQFDTSGYAAVAASLGINADAFSECLASDRYVADVAADFENALAVGATGTPHTIILIQGAEPLSISGALPYDDMKQVIDTALSRITP